MQQEFQELCDYMSASIRNNPNLFTLWIKEKQIDELRKYSYGHRIKRNDKDDLRRAHARLLRLTIPLIGNIISLSLAFRVCEEMESSGELDNHDMKERNVFLFKAVKHVLHGLTYEQDDECIDNGTKPTDPNNTNVSGVSVDDLMCEEKREYPIFQQIVNGLNYNRYESGIDRMFKKHPVLYTLSAFIEAEKENLWKSIIKRVNSNDMDVACSDDGYSISKFNFEQNITLPRFDREQWHHFFLKLPIPKSSVAVAAARGLDGTARTSQTNTANSMSENGAQQTGKKTKKRLRKTTQTNADKCKSSSASVNTPSIAQAWAQIAELRRTSSGKDDRRFPFFFCVLGRADIQFIGPDTRSRICKFLSPIDMMNLSLTCKEGYEIATNGGGMFDVHLFCP